MPDGLAIGVTTDVPDELREVPEILDALKQVWLIGFDGVMYDGDDFIDVDWHPADLRLGDRVGVLVTPAGLLKVYVNGKWRVDGPSNVDVSRALFPAVDLIGNTDGVEWIPQARCPAHRPSAMSRPDRGFHRGSLGRALRLSADGWSVEHQNGESLHGTALGAAHAELVEGVGRYFEARHSGDVKAMLNSPMRLVSCLVAVAHMPGAMSRAIYTGKLAEDVSEASRDLGVLAANV
ncbi:NEURL4 [Symbiodinium sp. KB8]|nr:NEURL4 [Symbiodinium sp. KB8]